MQFTTVCCSLEGIQYILDLLSFPIRLTLHFIGNFDLAWVYRSIEHFKEHILCVCDCTCPMTDPNWLQLEGEIIDDASHRGRYWLCLMVIFIGGVLISGYT